MAVVSQLSVVAADVLAGVATPQELLDVPLVSTVSCEAPESPGVTGDTPEGPVVPVYSSPLQLARDRGPVGWFSSPGWT